MSCAERIPSEIVLHILKQLDNQNDLVNCVPVCKLWGYHALELLWYKPALNQPLNWIAFCASLQSRYHSLPYNSFIRRINLTPLSTHVEDYQIACLAKCQRFERITLAGCTSLTDKGLCSLMSQGACHDLLSLDLSDVFDITNVTLYKVAESCPKLQGLNLNMTRQTCRITDSGVAQLAMHCKELKRIKLNNCLNITEQSAIILASNCPRLIEVDFMNCRITDEALDAIFYRCRELRELRMSHCENKNYVISDCMFAKLPTYHPFDAPYFQQLRLIDFTGITSITDDALASLVKVAPKIRSLVLNKCDKITDQGVFMICKLGRYLHFLHLGHCVLLTDRSIIQLALSCARIRYLDLACCCRITDRAISELANLPKLKRIGLVKCFQVTDESILAFTKSTRVPTTLERIHLSYCQQLSVRAISQLLNACTKLNHLSLTNVHDFLRDDLKYFCRVPPKEFNAQQRNIFCVFSGNGVNELRVYLNSMYKSNPFQITSA